MKKKKIKFGYEIKSGKEVEIPLAHTIITGITNLSGKTTAIMGLIRRSGLKAIIIKTKIGEKAITEGSIIPPFYKEDFDWEYASELLEASRKEKLKFERSWIIKYSKTAKNLLEFKQNIDNALAEGKLRELEKSVLITLQAYLEKILPELQYAPLSKTLDIRDGINIMDLERFKEETQGLIIRSVLNEVLTKEKNTIVVIPEAWKYLPERLSSPVKRPAEAFIRQGATNNNYLWIDSQEITGTSKTILKQVSVWCLGFQREVNEIKRTLDQIPLSKKSKPKPEEIATLKLGEFFVATSDFTKKTYSQPSWLDDKIAKLVSIGKKNVEDIEQPTHIAPYQIVAKKQEETGEIVKEYPFTSLDVSSFTKKINELRDDFISNRNDFFTKFQQINETISKIFTEIYKIRNENKTIDEDEIVMRVLQKIPITNINNQNPYSQIDEEALISKIIERIPKTAGTVTYEIAPQEALKKKFLEQEKNKILEDVSKATPKAKEVLKFIESVGKGMEIKEVCLRLAKTTTGSASQVIRNSINELARLRLVRKDTHSRVFPYLKDRITDELGFHKAKPEEIEQVYNHIIFEMLK